MESWFVFLRVGRDRRALLMRCIAEVWGEAVVLVYGLWKGLRGADVRRMEYGVKAVWKGVMGAVT